MALFLSAALLLSGCVSDGEAAIETGTTTASEAEASETTSAAETTSTAETTPAASETAAKESAEAPSYVSQLSLRKLEDCYVTIPDEYAAKFAPSIKNIGGSGYPFYRTSAYNALEITGWNTCRESSMLLGDGAVAAAKSKIFAEKISSPYEVSYNNPVLVFDPVEADSNTLKINEVKLGCNIYGTPETNQSIKVRAFIRKTDEDSEKVKTEFIIDPAYLRGIPVYSQKEEEMTFDINGEEVKMDSFPVTASVNFYEINGTLGSEYAYASLDLDGLGIDYSTKTGYSCEASVNSVNILTDDVSAAIDGNYLGMDEDGKDPEMSETFNAIVGSIDTIYTDDTYGIVLLDMDFDGTPEVLVSHYKPGTGESEWDRNYEATADVDVYRVKDGGLKYIDTMHLAHIVVYDVSNFLGLKTLDDGTKGWFATTREDAQEVDCLFTLEGDTLKKTEVFRAGDLTDDGDGYFYYFGEKVTPEIVHIELTEEEKNEPYAFEEKYVWNGITARFGTWELYGFARQDFCKDIEESYLLYSDWIVQMEDNYVIITDMQKNELSKRDVIFNLAYLVDAFYLGDYNPAKHSYEYRFLGDYAKPVIYLYPEEDTKVSISVDFTDGGAITCSYPEYNGGWNVTAMPDGTLYDENGDEYYCLYWEGVGGASFDRSKGWCVVGKDTAAFLREKLLQIGLTAREANEFIIYWLPIMQENPYNIISFHTESYAAAVPLSVSPAPDSVIRVFMTFEASESPVEIAPQELPEYERNGFTLVEWGGIEVTK